MSEVSLDLKRRIAALYTENEQKLTELDPDALESFAFRLLTLIEEEKRRTQFSHDLDVLERSMEHLRNDSAKLRTSKLGTDDHDFAENDCKHLVKSTKKWLELEGLI